MSHCPDIAHIAALIGDPARARILRALMGGQALSARKLADCAGVTPQTISSHLVKLSDAKLIQVAKIGRHKMVQLASDDIYQTLDMLGHLAADAGQFTPASVDDDPELRYARICYNHIAGDLGTQTYLRFLEIEYIREDDGTPYLTVEGAKWVERFGLDILYLAHARAPLCKSCLDWSTGQYHLAGTVGRGILQRAFDAGWMEQDPHSRVLRFRPGGQAAFERDVWQK